MLIDEVSTEEAETTSLDEGATDEISEETASELTSLEVSIIPLSESLCLNKLSNKPVVANASSQILWPFPAYSV